MRLIFVVLLIVNVVYAIGWIWYSEKESALLPGMAPIHSEKIVLIPTEENCLEWGNFDEQQVYEAESLLSEIVPDQSYTLEEAGNTLKYWLHIPPLPNRDMANRMINKLRNLGIISFRIKEDDSHRKNAISLGMFTDKNGALAQLKDIEKKGITNLMIEERNVAVQKIVIHGTTEEIKEQIQKVAEQFEDTRLIQNKCERL
ncbi:MAG: SPOR domain-containing protein [Nitrosomonas sp.]|nr:SPOR domain-containing protein [Nitrosomonas sp.]